MTVAIVVGNGRSREGQPLARLAGSVPLIGCNSAWQDIPLNAVCGIDERGKATHSKVPATTQVVHLTVGNPWVTVNRQQFMLSHGPYGWCSGRLAIEFTIKAYSPRMLYLVGFDFGSNTGGPNNIYHNEPQPRDLARFKESLTIHRDVRIIRVGDAETYEQVAADLPGLQHLSWTNFWKRFS